MNQAKQEPKQASEAQQPEPQDPKKQETLSKSSYVDLYCQKMLPYHPHVSRAFKYYLNQDDTSFSVKKLSYFTPTFTLTVIEESINKEVVTVNAKWGHFSINIRILHIREENTKHDMPMTNGAFGTIYQGQFSGQEFVLKCLGCKGKFSRNKAIKEWFLMKISSEFKVGPYVGQYFGFDILMFSECIEFGMEICQTIEQHIISDQLYQNLSIMHALHLVHLDIKPENIMYSPIHKRLVFIDFGLSKIIEEGVGSRTMTNYVGSIIYWGEQMKKCFTEKKKMLVDLYYNDLHALNASIQDHNSLQQNNKINYKEQEVQNQVRMNNFNYLTIILLKYYVYKNSFDIFERCWLENRKNTFFVDNQTYYKAQLLYFLEQLVPNSSQMSFFTNFFNQTYKQTPIYQKIKILYETSLNALFSAQIFRVVQKYNYFNTICNQYLVQDDTVSQNQKDSIRLFLTSRKLIRSTLFIYYIKLYLEYINYMDNRHLTEKEERQEVAKVYQEQFIQNNGHSQINGRQLIQLTIVDALDKCCKLQPTQKDKRQTLAFLFFQLFDFILILDIGTVQDNLRWLDSIIYHKNISLEYKHLFLARIIDSLYFCLMKPTPKKGASRLSFGFQLQKWSRTWINKLNINLKQIFSRQLYNTLNSNFLFCYGFEIIQVELRLSNFSNHDKILKEYIQLYYILLSRQQRKQILYLLPKIIEFKFSQGNINECKQIRTIFRDNIRDQSILKEFQFEILQQAITIAMCPPSLLTYEHFASIELSLSKIMTEDLYIFKMYLINIVLLINQLQVYHHLNFKYFKQEGQFIVRFFESYKKQMNYVFKECNNNCCELLGLQQLFMISRVVEPDRQEEVIQLIDFGLKNVKCQRCYNIISLMSRIIKLDCLHLQIKYSKQETFQKEQKVNQFIKQYQLLCSIYQKQNIFSYYQNKLISAGLTYGLMICHHIPELQQQIQGAQNHYVFNKNFMGGIGSLFQSSHNNKYIMMTLQIFSKNNKKLFIEGICEICKTISDSYSLRYYEYFQRGFTNFLNAYSEQRLLDLFKSLTHTAKNKTSECIVLALIPILSKVEDKRFRNTIRSSILTKVENLYHKFQRVVLVKFHEDVRRQIIDFQDNKHKNERKLRYINNRFVKLLVIDHNPVAQKVKKRGNVFEHLLRSKAASIGSFHEGSCKLKICLK